MNLTHARTVVELSGNGHCYSVAFEGPSKKRFVQVLEDGKLLEAFNHISSLTTAGHAAKLVEAALDRSGIVQVTPQMGRKARQITYNGETKDITQWARALKIRRATIYARLKNGYPAKDALRTEDLRSVRRGSNIKRA